METLPGADHRICVQGTGGAARQAARMMAVALLAGLLLGAGPLRQWTEALPDGAIVRPVQQAALAWERTAAACGLTRPYAALRSWVHGMDAPL